MTGGGKLFPGLLAGLFIGVLSGLPFINFANCCCLWVITGGALASYLYQQNQDEPMTPADGLLAGLIAGLFGAVVGTLISIPISYVTLPFFQNVFSRVLETAEDVPPGVQDMIESMRISTAGAVFGFMFSLFINVIFAPIGGLLGAVLFKKAAPPAPPSPASYQAPPPIDLPPVPPPPPPPATPPDLPPPATM